MNQAQNSLKMVLDFSSRNVHIGLCAQRGSMRRIARKKAFMNPRMFLTRRRQLIESGATNQPELKEIVALELMSKIADLEQAKHLKEQIDNPREYYLTLYSQCSKVVSGEDVEEVLEDYEE